MHHSPIEPGDLVHPTWCQCSLCTYPLPGSRAERAIKVQFRVFVAVLLILPVLLVLNWRGIAQSFGLAS